MALEDFSIEREGQPDLVFTGEIIGRGPGTNPSARIYRTKGGKFIVRLGHDTDRAAAHAFDKPNELVQWVRARDGGTMRPEFQAAVEEAAKADDSFKAFWTEKVD